MLREGARIGVIATGGVVARERVLHAYGFIESCGWKVVEAPHLFDRVRYLAGTAPDRAADLVWALTAPDLDAVWLARGGYGTAQLLSQLPWNRFVPRPFIGFSDATAILWPLARRGFETIHGPVLTMLGVDEHAVDDASRQAIRMLLTTGRSAQMRGEHLCGPRRPATGKLVGGNLTVLASLAGTPEALAGRGAVIVLEDVSEAPYRLERSLCQLVDSGAFDGAAAIVLGEFTRCDAPPDADYTLDDVWRAHLQGLDIPVFHRFPIGHGKQNLAFRHGAPATLSENGTLTQS